MNSNKDQLVTEERSVGSKARLPRVLTDEDIGVSVGTHPGIVNEKRKSVRFDTNLYTLFLYPDFDVERVCFTDIINISCSGGYLLSKKRLAPFTDIMMRVFMPQRAVSGTIFDGGRDEESLLIGTAQVIRIEDVRKEKAADAGFGFGFQFKTMNQLDASVLTEFMLFLSNGKRQGSIKEIS